MSKTILITGASTGIGAETAIALAKGNHLLLHYNRSHEAVKVVSSAVEKEGGRSLIVQADLSTEEGTAKLVDVVRSEVDKLDLLFTIMRVGSLEGLKLEK